MGRVGFESRQVRFDAPGDVSHQGRAEGHRPLEAVYRCALRTLDGFSDYPAIMPVRGWLGSRPEEGRAKQRYAPGRCKEPAIRGYPNGTSQHASADP